MKSYASADEYYKNTTEWKDELGKLRKILQQLPLEETVKWGGPVYTWEGKNVVAVGGFKDWVALWFYQGALLSDPEKVLVSGTEGRTKAQRHWRFRDGKEIRVAPVKSYLREALELARSGKQIRPDRDKPLEIPTELKKALAGNRKAQQAFEKMTKGNKREYAEYIADAKREETKQKRLEKILPMIAAGTGLNDRYR
jgi:uncharacterized protein YdeI (YjbR/CyaY-like superfamily)